MEPRTIDQAKLETFVNRAVGDIASAYGGVMVSLGHKLGLYKAMAGANLFVLKVADQTLGGLLDIRA